MLSIGHPRDLIMQDESIEVLIRRIYEEGIEWEGEQIAAGAEASSKGAAE